MTQVTSLQHPPSVGESNYRSSVTVPRRGRGGLSGPVTHRGRGRGGAAAGLHRSHPQGRSPISPRRRSIAKSGNLSSNKPNPFSTNYRIVWGTRFATSEPEQRAVLAALLSPEQLASLVISKSVKRGAGGLRWWLTLMADSGTLASLDLSWSHPSWTLRRSLARTSDSSGDSGNVPVHPLPLSSGSASGSTVSPPSVDRAAASVPPVSAISQPPASTTPSPLSAVGPVFTGAAPRASDESG